MWYQPGPGAGNATGKGPDTIPDWGVFDTRVPNSTSGNQYNARVDYNLGSNQFFASTYLVNLNNVNGGTPPPEEVGITPTNTSFAPRCTRPNSSITFTTPP